VYRKGTGLARPSGSEKIAQRGSDLLAAYLAYENPVSHAKHGGLTETCVFSAPHGRVGAIPQLDSHLGSGAHQLQPAGGMDDASVIPSTESDLWAT